MPSIPSFLRLQSDGPFQDRFLSNSSKISQSSIFAFSKFSIKTLPAFEFSKKIEGLLIENRIELEKTLSLHMPLYVIGCF